MMTSSSPQSESVTDVAVGKAERSASIDVSSSMFRSASPSVSRVTPARTHK